MRAGGPGGGVGGMMGGMKGMGSSGMRVANEDNLTDEAIVGAAYDHKVVTRLMTYIWPYKRDAFIALGAVLVYTLGNVTIPLLMIIGITWAINASEVWRLHVGYQAAGEPCHQPIGQRLDLVRRPIAGKYDLFTLRM